MSQLFLRDFRFTLVVVIVFTAIVLLVDIDESGENKLSDINVVSIFSETTFGKCADGRQGNCQKIDPLLPHVNLELPAMAAPDYKAGGLTTGIYLNIKYVDGKVVIGELSPSNGLTHRANYFLGRVSTVKVVGRKQNVDVKDILVEKIKLQEGTSASSYKVYLGRDTGYTVYDSEICSSASPADVYFQKKGFERCLNARVGYLDNKYENAFVLCDRTRLDANGKIRRPICSVYSSGTSGLLISYKIVGPVSDNPEWVDVDLKLNTFIQNYIR